MKLATTLCVCLAPVGSAFVAAPGGAAKTAAGRSTSLMAKPDDRTRPGKGKVALTPKQAKTILGASPTSAPERKAPAMSTALPFLKCPPTLDGAMAADFGFDPLGFADSYENLNKYREAEVKHGRLAMLAAAGWPLSELWDAKIARFLDLEPALNADGRVPSVLNGGLGRVSVAYWIGVVALAAALDAYGTFFASKRDGYTPGDFGLRGFYPEDVKGQNRMRLAEIKHGRLAMVAITAFAAQEFVSHSAVVDHAALFFRPISEVLMRSEVPQYYTPETIEAASTLPPAITEAPAAVEAAASAIVEALGAVSPIPATEALSAAPVDAAAGLSPPVLEDLDAAKQRIVDLTAQIAFKEELVEARSRIIDLEDKLKQIETLVR